MKTIEELMKDPNYRREVSVGIKWDLTKMDGAQKKLLWEITRQLGQLGVTFDTGSNGAVLDWEWDWSLSGPVKVLFRNFVDEESKNRYVREKEDGPRDAASRSEGILAVEGLVNLVDTSESN